jgi:tetratricopeptide (TPR) repeat protein
MIDRDIHLARALLVESNAMMRSVAAGQLRDLGVGHVTNASRVKEARLLLERERYDIVICNREFEGSDYSGQDLLDELRREQLLPHSTVFLMVVEKATYHQVIEAAEAALDGFLVRPYTAAVLSARLLEARNRKRELADVLKALDAGTPEVALVRAIKRFQEQQPYWIYCGRLAAELLLSLQRPEDARTVFQRILLAKPQASWARLGIARAQIGTGELAAARKTVAEVLAADPRSADAHDLLGRILVEQCDFDGALAEYRAAAEATPGCLLRAQHAGALAFYQGAGDEALKHLERTLAMGVQSKLFDALTLLLIAMLRFDRQDTVGVAAMREQLKRFRERHPESRRLQRLEHSAAVLLALLGRQDGAALELLQALSAESEDPRFDLESANMLLALWSRVPEALRPAAGHEVLVTRIALRFCVSKAITEVLVASAQRGDAAASLIRRGQAQVAGISEQAMEHALQGRAADAVALLLAEGEKTGNAKLLEIAQQLVRRHRTALADADALAARVATALRHHNQAASHIAGIQRSGRSPGGLQLRGRAEASDGGAGAEGIHAAA